MSLADNLRSRTNVARMDSTERARRAEADRKRAHEAEVEQVALTFLGQRTQHLEELLRLAADRGLNEHEVWKHEAMPDKKGTVEHDGVMRGYTFVENWLKERGLKTEVRFHSGEGSPGAADPRYPDSWTLVAKW